MFIYYKGEFPYSKILLDNVKTFEQGIIVKVQNIELTPVCPFRNHNSIHNVDEKFWLRKMIKNNMSLPVNSNSLLLQEYV